WNCNGIKSHFDELLHYISSSTVKPSLICLQETHATNDSLPSIPGYSYTHNFRLDRKGGGTAIYVINGIYFNIININKSITSQIEISGVEICGPDNKSFLDIFSVYIAPNLKFNMDNLKQLLVNKNHIIVGDLNAKHLLWGSPVRDHLGKIIVNFIEKNDLVCLNTGKGTRLNNNPTLSHLDLSFSNLTLSSKLV